MEEKDTVKIKKIPRLELDDIILTILREKLYIRRKELIAVLTNKASEVTINRRIKALKDKSKIKIIKNPELEVYGIIDLNKKASYLVFGTDEYYETVIKSLQNESERELALKELEFMTPIDENEDEAERHTIPLFPKTLTALSNLLRNEKLEICERIIRILYKEVKRGNLPSDINKFQENLIETYEKVYNNTSPYAVNMPYYIIFMLGIFNNPKIIEFLKRDVSLNGDVNSDCKVVRIYNYWTVAELIEKNRTELFNFAKTLSKEKSVCLSMIRRNALKNLPEYKEKIKPFQEKIEAMNK